MKTLIVEDDFLTRAILSALLSQYGVCHVAVNGQEAIEAVERAHGNGEPYDLMCLDILMPVMDGHKALVKIRKIEKRYGLTGVAVMKVIMITAVEDFDNIIKAFGQGQCEAYLTKPLDRDQLLNHLVELGLIQER